MKGTIICYGDSNTYGYDPRSFMGDRYGKDIRWTGVLAEKTDWSIRNHGMNGRCIPYTASQIRFACEQTEEWGREQAPLWFAVMLGTNDLLMEPGFRAEDAAERMEKFLLVLSETEAVKSGRICLWLIAPPAMKRGAWVEEDSLCLESERLGGEYRKIAEKLGIRYTDAGQWDIQVVFDGVHFSEEGHRKFAEGMVKELTD